MFDTGNDFDDRRPSARSTGFVFAAVCAIAIYLARATLPLSMAFGIAGCLFAVLAAVRPAILEPLNAAWFRLSLVLARLVNPVIMAALYFLLTVPYGIVMQRFRDPLRLRRNGSEQTYWAEVESSEPHSMKRQY